MKKQFYLVGLSILIILTISIVPVSCKKTIKPTEIEPISYDAKHVERVKKWFQEIWQNSIASTTSRVSPWLHDTSFIINNYSNIILDWRYARIINYGGYTYTEVPATLPDTLEFKIGPPNEDTTAFLNLMVDNVYRNQSQSKLFWVLREASGQDPIAEIVTFVGDYQYTKDNFQRFTNSISYFDLGGYTGEVLYHDRYGKLIRALSYVRGEITNTIRCGIEGGLDPAPGNRVHLDVCLEILTFERDCITTYTDDAIYRECSEWILVGSRMVGNCWATGGSGGGGGSENYTPYKEDGMSCNSFQFTQTTGDWQEAGVKNTRVKVFWIGGGRSGTYINVTIEAPIIVGIPITRGGTTYISQGRAAELAARASDYAHGMTKSFLKRNPTRPTDSYIEETYRRFFKAFMLNEGGTAGRVYQGMSPTVIIKNAVYTFLGNGDCD
jgi:hypothetical protein